MPYKDPEKRRAVQRECQRARRTSTPRQPLPALGELRLETAKDVIAMLKTELSTFLRKKGLEPSERLRGAVMAGTALLRAFEQVDLLERIEGLEARLTEVGKAA